MMKRLDGDLNTAEEGRLAEHLQSCPECGILSREFDEMNELFTMEMTLLPAIEAERVVMARVREIDRYSPKQKTEANNGNFMVLWSLTAFILIAAVAISQRGFFGLSFPAHLGRWAASLTRVVNAVQIFVEIGSGIFSESVQGLSREIMLTIWTGTAFMVLWAMRSLVRAARTRGLPSLG